MFDRVHFEMPCPNCGATLREFQSKDAGCNLDLIEPDGLECFYTSCDKCDSWVEFFRQFPESPPLRGTPLTREQVEAMGFVLSVTPPPNAALSRPASADDPVKHEPSAGSA